MHSLGNRAINVPFYGLWVLFFLAAASSVTTLWFQPVAVVNTLSVNRLRSFVPQKETARNMPPIGRDRAILTFDLDADLSGVFNWNVKQLFVFITADFQTPKNAANSVVIWDKVVPTKEDAKLKYKGERAKYPLIDQHQELRGVPVSLTLHWDATPITGLFSTTISRNHTVTLPADYCQDGMCALL